MRQLANLVARIIAADDSEEFWHLGQVTVSEQPPCNLFSQIRQKLSNDSDLSGEAGADLGDDDQSMDGEEDQAGEERDDDEQVVDEAFEGGSEADASMEDDEEKDNIERTMTSKRKMNRSKATTRKTRAWKAMRSKTEKKEKTHHLMTT